MLTAYRQGLNAANRDIDRIWSRCLDLGIRRRDANRLTWAVAICDYEADSMEFEQWMKGYQTEWQRRMARVKSKLPLPSFLPTEELAEAEIDPNQDEA